MKNLEIVVTEDRRIELTVDGADSFLLETNYDGSAMYKLQTLLALAERVQEESGTCRLTMGEIDETA